MSQTVGQIFKSRIPTLGDDASIQEALRVYHYGVDNYSTQPIPNDSIEGNFRSIDTRITTIEDTISSAIASYITRISSSSSPNIITAQNATTIPLTVRAIASQTSSLQQWQNSSNISVASMSTAGSLGIAGYLSLGSTTISSTTSLNINIINSSHNGIIVKSSSGQSASLQEWQDSYGNVLSWVNSNGEVYSMGAQVQTVDPFLLMGS